jgi:hypothetical protein
MIGAPPTFYDPEQEVPPQTHNYHDWATPAYDQQQQQQHPLAASSSYPPQPSTTDPRPERQAQRTTRHHNQYQFVPQHPLTTTSDAARYNYLSIPNQFDDRQSQTQTLRPQRVAQPVISTQDWTQQSSHVFAPANTSTDYFDLLTQFPPQDTHDEHQAQPTDYLTPNLAVTPVSESTLHSAQNVSPGWGHPPLPSPSSNTPTGTVIVPLKRRDKNKPKRKRQSTETDDDEDDDVVGSSVDPNIPRPNLNRL